MAAVSWKSGVSGNWTLAADWSTGAVPGAADDATIAVAGSYTVSVSTAITVDSITLSDLSATLAIVDPGKTEAVAKNFITAGAVKIDTTGGGGTKVTVGGTLSNSGTLVIGNSGISTASTVTAAALANTGTIDLTGGTAQATLDVTGATLANLTGDYVLRGNALLEVEGSSVSPSGGSIVSIAGHAELVLDGAQSRVAQSTGTTTNSGLISLATNNGTLAIQLGSSIAAGGALTNNGLIEVDNDIFGTGDAGGSSLTVAGTLTNRGDLDIGNSGLTTAATVKAAGLANAAMGTIDLTGDTAKATLDITGAAAATLTGFYYLQGDTLLEFGSGHITAIAANSELQIDGPGAWVALSSAATSNSALTALATNSGILDLEDTSLTTTTAFANHNQLSVDGGTLSLGGALTNTGDFSIDAASPVIGGAVTNSGDLSITDGNLTIDGGLTNSGSIQIDGGSSAIQVTASALSNTGTIDLSGGAGRAALDIAAAAPATLTGNLGLSGNALMEFVSGGISTIASGAGLALDGPRARVALNSNTTTSGALSGLGRNQGTLDLGDGAVLTTTTALINSGTLDLDSFDYGSDFSDDGGSTLTIGGVLTNSSQIDIGNSNILAPTALTAAGLSNTGTIDLTGGAVTLASLHSTAAAPATWTGSAFLSGDAVLEFVSGGITAIGGGADLSLDGAKSLVALSTAVTTDSALTKLAGNAGTFSLAGGAALTTTVAFGNTSFVDVDTFGNGGSHLTFGGALTNSTTGTLDIGNSGITAATIATAPGLANTGTIELTGAATTPATLDITAAAPATLAGTFDLSGDALLEYKSGGITAIGSGASLSLNGAKSLVALGTVLTTDSALTGLASNAGTLNLENGASLTTTVGLTNSSFVEVDSSFGGGGSVLTIGGTLTNKGTLDIGNYNISKAATVTVASVANSGTIDLTSGTAAATLKVTGAFGNTGFVEIDTGFGGGGSILTIGGTLTNSATFEIGSTIAKATTVTAAGLSNTGTIELTGAATTPATLDITAAAPATLAGTFDLSGDALLEYKSGGITAIGSGASLSLNGAKSLVALSTALTTDSALTGLASNAGVLTLENGAALTTTVGLTNSGTLEVDYFGSSGGSSLTIGGTLTNNSFENIDVGNSGLTAATKLTAAALTDNGSINIGGGTGSATGTLSLTGASSDTGSITVSAGGVLALGNTLTVAGDLILDGGTVSGGTLATSGSGVIETGFGEAGTLTNVTIATGSTFAAEFDSTLTDNGVTVNGSLYGSGGATLDFAKTGTDSLTNVSGFTTIGLANGAANTLTLVAANFTGTAGVITVNDGNSGNTVSGSTLTSADSIIVHAGTGADVLTGGAGNDVFYAGGDTTMTGGGGINQFIFSAAGAATNKIADFSASSTNELVFSNSNFSLGLSGASSTPQAISSSETATLFTANSTGAFANTNQRLAYNTTNGELFSSTGGSGGTSHLIATLTGEPAINTANQLFFIS